MGAGFGPPPVWVYAICAKNNVECFLLEKLKNTLGHLIGLGQHSLSGLNQDVVLSVGHHFLGHIGVTDGGLSVLDVLLTSLPETVL